MSGLREKKFARTRLALAGALTEALTRESFAEVSVKSLCRAAEVSEATFFNYFQRKQDLMSYLAHLWFLELGWHIRAGSPDSGGLRGIDELFARTAKTCAAKPGVFKELLIWIAQGGNQPESLQLTAIEKRLAFPDLQGIEDIPVRGIDAWLVGQIEGAIAAGDLPANTLIPTVLASLLAILLGVPLTLLASDPDKIGGMYRQQLTLLWAGVRATMQGR
jgi:AcrR family transcriptional regulator